MILVIGYGNTLRGDDGVGQHIARRLEVELYSDAVQVIACHQLTPELADPVSRADLVVFVDASETGRPGEIQVSNVESAFGTGAFTHDVTPASLIAAAYDLYGTHPSGILITITGIQFAYSDALSPRVEASAEEVVRRIHHLIGTHAVAYELGHGK